MERQMQQDRKQIAELQKIIETLNSKLLEETEDIKRSNSALQTETRRVGEIVEGTVVKIEQMTNLDRKEWNAAAVKVTTWVVGIPVVMREIDSPAGPQPGPIYVLETISEILRGVDAEQRKRLKIVLLLAEPNEAHLARLRSEIEGQFLGDINSGLIDLIVPPKGLYLRLDDPCKLARNWGDSLLRVLWRSKQVLDTAYLMDYARFKGDYYLHLEDDTPPRNDRPWLRELEDWVVSKFKYRDDWGILKFFNCGSRGDAQVDPEYKIGGMIGLLFRSSSLEKLVPYLRENFDQEPIDWMVGSFTQKSNLKIVVHQPELVNHVGTVSTKSKVLRWEALHPHGNQIDLNHTASELLVQLPQSWDECDSRAHAANFVGGADAGLPPTPVSQPVPAA
eukprot:TRINITY_DN2632_c0_g1_i2.p1 TRINITY_DN2632_c0_g1~~TRINITY_DN2632_c0_g1_i2.p1  ORF type:complete len:458 (+),score=56.48 TRINITY_DN2632_c0_g1_i2:199-1374(+)